VAYEKKWMGGLDVLRDSATGAILVADGVNAPPGAVAKFAKIDANSDAAAGNEIVAAVVGKKIRVVSMRLAQGEAGANVATWYSGPADTGTALDGGNEMSLAPGYVERGKYGELLLETVAGESLVLLLTAALQVRGRLTYFEV